MSRLQGAQRANDYVIFFLMLLLWCLMAKRQISCSLCLLYLVYPTTYMHMECCDWLNSAKATSSCHLDYLSAGRSRLGTFLQYQITKMVSISLSSSRLARHPHPSLGIDAPLGGIVPLGVALQVDSLPGALVNVVGFGCCPAIACPWPDSSALGSWFSLCPRI